MGGSSIVHIFFFYETAHSKSILVAYLNEFRLKPEFVAFCVSD